MPCRLFLFNSLGNLSKEVLRVFCFIPWSDQGLQMLSFQGLFSPEPISLSVRRHLHPHTSTKLSYTPLHQIPSFSSWMQLRISALHVVPKTLPSSVRRCLCKIKNGTMWHPQKAHLFTCIIWLCPHISSLAKKAGRHAIKTLWFIRSVPLLGYNVGILCQSSKSLCFFLFFWVFFWQPLREEFKYIQYIPPCTSPPQGMLKDGWVTFRKRVTVFSCPLKNFFFSFRKHILMESVRWSFLRGCENEGL